MSLGYANFVLHTHLPYCRMAGRWPHGEEWLHEAMLECYLPLVQAFRRLSAQTRGSLGVTINITPILAEQLDDPLVCEHFAEYLGERVERARDDVKRFANGHGLRGKAARFHLDRYEATRTLWEDELRRDVLGAFAELEASGRIEIATSAATHGYLPLLDDPAAVRFQVQTGVASHVRNFGRQPRSFWLPECAYEPGLEAYLEEVGIRVFFVETHLITGGRARGKTLGGMLGLYPETRQLVPDPVEVPPRSGTTFHPYTVGHSHVAALARNERTGLQVWSAAHGYPGDPAYREFHKKDDVSGLHYWRVTGPDADLGFKQEYDPEMAARVSRSHADHFRDLVKSELQAYWGGAGEPGVVVAAYDTELLGHWWLEGVPWLEMTIRDLSEDADVELITAGDFVAAHPPRDSIDLPEGSWGNGGDHRTWLNRETAWTWPEIRARQERAHQLLDQPGEASQQLARELLLLQSSDWQFLMTTGQAHDYAVERFQGHAERFDELAEAMETQSSETASLVEELAEVDNPFPDIDPSCYRSGMTTSASKA
jgi:1,4-alpha-glucan branching enzyme